MDSATALLIACVAIYVFFRIKSGFRKHKAAMNACLAKVTFENLTTEDQERVVSRSTELATAYGNDEQQISELNQRQGYGLYALAMAELDIAPSLPEYNWSLVKNPLTSLKAAEREINAARQLLQKKNGVDVEI